MNLLCAVLLVLTFFQSTICSDLEDILNKEQRLCNISSEIKGTVIICERTSVIDFKSTLNFDRKVVVVQYYGNISEVLPNTFNAIDNNVLEIRLNGVNLNKIYPDSFAGGLVKLKSLNLSGNNIEQIEDGTFEGLTNLEQLHISGNRIKSLGKSLQILGKLVHLRCVDNEIKVLGGSLNNLTRVQEVDLSLNQLTGIDVMNFKGLKQLRKLCVSHNALETIMPGSFIDQLNLDTLNLSRNNLNSFKFGIFRGLVRLGVLDLSYNSITYFKRGVFQPLYNLKYLIIDGNSISALTMTIDLPKVQMISFGGNDNNCNNVYVLYKHLYHQHIDLSSLDDVKYGENINGIGCS